jgi:YbgC/YbaW family acyl-CoA thioester hydrolase
MFQLDSDKNYPRKLESKAIIRFQDCDPLKHLNNAKYFDYFFNAREDQVAEIYKFDPNDYFEHNQTSWVVYNHQIAYLNSAKVSEWVNIISSIIYFNENTKITEFVMTDETKKVLKCVMWTTSKYINTDTGIKTNHQPEIMNYLNRISLQGIDMQLVTFANRLKTIKAELLGGVFIQA